MSTSSAQMDADPSEGHGAAPILEQYKCVRPRSSACLVLQLCAVTAACGGLLLLLLRARS